MGLFRNIGARIYGVLKNALPERLMPVRKAVQPRSTGMYLSDPNNDLHGTMLDFRVLYDLYLKQSDISACIREWKQNVGSYGYNLVNPKDKTKDVEPAVADQVSLILNNVQTFTEMKERVIRDLGICGNAYGVFLKNESGSEWVGIQIVDPRTMAIVMDQYGEVYRYVQRVPGKEAVIFNTDEVVHWKFGSDINNESFGESPIQPVIWEGLTDVQSMQSNYSFFANDARPSTVYVLEPAMTKEASEEVDAYIKREFSGAKNKHKSAVMKGLKDIKTIGMSHKDMDFVMQRKFVTEKICSAFGVPKFMLGYTDSVNNNNGIELTKNFLMNTIFPLEESFTSTLNKALAKLGDVFDGKVKIEFIRRPLESESERERRAVAMFVSGVMTLRETKRFLDHEITPEYEAQENFDTHVIHNGASATPISDIGLDPILDFGATGRSQNFIQQLEELSQKNESK